MQFDEIDINIVISIAKEAGIEVLKVYNKDFNVDYKDNKSPVTQADMESNKIIIDKLKLFYPQIPILSEEIEEVEYELRKDWDYYWCIDPLDGTKEFISKNGEFSINIALVYNNKPVLGVVYLPFFDDIYYAKRDCGAYKNGKKLPLYTNSDPKEKLKVLVSRSHITKETQNFIENLDSKNIQKIQKGSSLKLCLVAEGVADIYPRLGYTMEWDTAASDIIIRESGKRIIDFENKVDLIYNKKNLRNPWFLVQ